MLSTSQINCHKGSVDASLIRVAVKWSIPSTDPHVGRQCWKLFSCCWLAFNKVFRFAHQTSALVPLQCLRKQKVQNVLGWRRVFRSMSWEPDIHNKAVNFGFVLLVVFKICSLTSSYLLFTVRPWCFSPRPKVPKTK